MSWLLGAVMGTMHAINIQVQVTSHLSQYPLNVRKLQFQTRNKSHRFQKEENPFYRTKKDNFTFYYISNNPLTQQTVKAEDQSKLVIDKL